VSARVVGLDLSMTATGVCDADGRCTTIKPTQPGDERLVYIAALTAVAGRGADLVVIEDLPTHAHSAGITGMVHGAARLVLLNQKTPYVLLPPASLKKFATGRGNAGKPEMAVALYKRLALELADDNQVDAAWLRIAGLQLLGEPVVELPAAQVAALDKVLIQLNQDGRS
jgi:Holliday junction resolvasome RuvABC endonuclease subunit